ncbi:hypothetical protein [Cytophaga sp. FL35]|uniref:hypothetical protein n=1 Tax=Cytophaga sp. FL35 TaxID=1904456 RepID=UPI001653E394|nr:hypothetical protein [Cytophaga sp. FL35]MBC7000388.1 hypothetical protein [Cytophaga sp. FL35]
MAVQEVNKKTIDDYKDDYLYYTGKTSELNRNLAFAGVAIIWIFKTTSESGFVIPKELISPLIWLVISLSLDLFQYLCGGLIWLIFYRYYENMINNKKRKPNKDLKAHPILPGVLHFFYWSKIVANLIAYYLLLSFLFKELFH